MGNNEAVTLSAKGLEALANGHENLAMVCFQQAAEIENSPFIASYLGLCLAVALKDYQTAISLVRGAVEQEPANRLHYLHLGKVYNLAGKRIEAIKTFRAGLALGRYDAIISELEQLGVRKSPVFTKLARDHFLNKYLGKILSRLGARWDLHLRQSMENILIIEDSKVTQLYLANMLSRHYEVTCCDDGAAGIDVAMELQPDLILLDVTMPRMNGFEACRILKESELTKEIPILFITALNSEEEKVKGFEAGAEDYIIKPFSMSELLARVKVHISSRRAKKQSIELERLKIFKEMAVALSHEINNPLAAMYGLFYVLEKELAQANPEVKEIVDNIHNELSRIKEITDRLANASQIARTSYVNDTMMIDIDNI